MNKSYDLFEGGISEMIADLEKEKQLLIEATEKTSKRLGDRILPKIRENASTISDPDNYRDVTEKNEKRFRKTKFTSTVEVLNTGKQTTFSEYGYGIIGSTAPYPHGDIFGGDSAVGWEGYDLDTFDGKKTAKDEKTRAWYYKGKKTWGEKSEPVFYKTFTWLYVNAPFILAEEIERAFKKL